MIAFLCFFELLQVRIEFLLTEKRGTVEPLELLAAGVVLPVCPGDAHQLESANAAGMRDVRAAAQVNEFALPVETQRRILLEVIVDVLDFVPLRQVRDQRTRLRSRPLEPLERLRILDNLPHLFFDARKILFTNRRWRIDVVVETVL